MSYTNIRISTLNCNGLKDKKDLILKSLGVRPDGKLLSQHPDILLLQETHLKESDIEDIKDEWKAYGGSHSFFAKGHTVKRTKGGVGILLGSRKIFSNIKKPKILKEGRVLRLDLDICKVPFTILSVYAPNNEKIQFFQEFERMVKIPTPNHVICGGDWNCVEDFILDRTSEHAKPDPGIDILKNFMKSRSLVDPFRLRHPEKKIFTKYTKSHNTYSRIDRIYTSECFAHNSRWSVRSLGEVDTGAPDHNLWSITIRIPDADKKPAKIYKSPTFRFNNRFLKMNKFKEGMEKVLNEIQNLPTGNHKSTWVTIKNLITDYAKQFGKECARQEKQSYAEYYANCEELETESMKDEPNPQKIQQISTNISKFERSHDKKLAFLSKMETFRNESSTTTFLRSLKIRKQQVSIDSLRDDEQTKVVTTNPNIILDKIHAFYKDLYDEHKDEINEKMMDELLEKYNPPKIPQDMLDKLNAPITVDELNVALQQLAKHKDKAPGIDGLTAEFYTEYAEFLLPYLQAATENILQDMELDHLQSTAIVVLIFKKGHEDLLAHYRPVSVLPVDYKTIARVKANRLLPILPLIISEEQTCAIPGRTIADSTNFLRDIIDYATLMQKPSILFSLDMEKAFDRVSHTFLMKVLEKTGLPENFIKWTKCLYKGATSRVRNNGKLTEPVPFNRGVRQGCPLSLYLFVLVAETLSHAIRNEPKILGINIPRYVNSKLVSKQVKISAYADDTAFLLQGSHPDAAGATLRNQSLDALYTIMDKYCLASGAKLNASKCKALTFGGNPRFNSALASSINSSRTGTFSMDKITFRSIEEANGVNILGIHYHPNPTDCINLNYQPIHEKMEKAIVFHGARNLSFRGRVIVANSIILAKLWSTATIIPLCNYKYNPFTDNSSPNSKDWLKTFEQTITQFIMKGKDKRIEREIQAKSTENGGWGRHMVGPKCLSLQSKQLRDALDPKNLKLATGLARVFLSKQIPLQFRGWNLAVPPSLEVDKKLELKPYQSNRFIAGILYNVRESTLESNKDLFRNSIVAIDYNIPTSKEVYKAIITNDLSSAINPGEEIWKGTFGKNFIVPWERSYKLYNNWFKQDTFFWFKHCKLLRGEALVEECAFCDRKPDPKKHTTLRLRTTFTHPDDPHFHTFFKCKELNPIWKKMMVVFNLIHPDRESRFSLQNPSKYLVGCEEEELDEKSSLIDTITNIAIFKIWKWRGKVKFGEKKFLKLVLLEDIISSVLKTLKIQFSMKRAVGLEHVLLPLVKYCDGSLKFHPILDMNQSKTPSTRTKKETFHFYTP